MKTKLFVTTLLLTSLMFLQIGLLQSVFAETIQHDLNVTVLINNYTLIDIIEGDENTPAKYVYCVEASASCDEPIEHAEMTPPNHTWILSPTGKEKNVDGYSPNWGYIVTFEGVGTHSTTATAAISFSNTAGNDTHNYSGSGSQTIQITVSADVTPQPCPDTCQEENCDECSGNTCPAPTTMTTNAALGGLGVMSFAASSNTRIQNFSHNTGQGEATLDYIVNETEPNLAGYDNNYRYNNMFGNGVRFIKPIIKPKLINVAQKTNSKIPQLITVELQQYGPILFKEPKTIVFDAKDAKPGVSYRFSIPVDVSSLNSGSYDWQVQITRHYEDGTADQSIAVGRQGIFNNLNSGLGKGWVFGLTPKLVKNGNDILFYYRGMHKFNLVKKKWIADKTYDLSDYDLTGNWLNGFKMTAKDGSFRVFNSSGQITSETNAAGNTASYEYNDIGRLSKKILPDKTSTEFRYDKDTGYLKDIVAPGGNVTTITHNETGQIITVTGPSPDDSGLLPPSVTRFTYNADNLITSVTMPNGETTRYDYDHAKRLSRITHPDGRVESFICPVTAGIIETKNGEGTKDKPAKLIPTDSIVGTKIVDNQKTISKYGIWGYPLEITDAIGNVTAYKRNSQGQVTEEKRIAVDETGKQVDLIYRYEYDKRGNRIKEILPFDHGVRTWEYDTRTNAIKKFIDVTGETIIYEIDPQTGNTIRTISFDDEKSADAYSEEHYSYTPPPVNANSIAGGLLIAKIDLLGFAAGNAYNSKNKLVEKFIYVEGGEIHSADGVAEWNFDKLSPNKRYEIFVSWEKKIGNSLRTNFSCFQKDKNEPDCRRIVNQNLEPHKHVYGSLGQKENYQSLGQITPKTTSIKITATKTDKSVGDIPKANIRLIEIKTETIYRYDNEGRLIAQIDAKGGKIEYNYDKLNHTVKTVKNDTLVTESFYDYAGREAYSKNEFGIISGKIFDSADRVIEEFYFEPEIKTIDVSIKKDSSKKIVGSINNLDQNKRYEILASWKPDVQNSISAKFTVNSGGENILIKTVDQTIAAGKHPIAGMDYRSIGIIETKNGTVEISLESETDVSLTNLKIIEIESQSRYRYNNSGLVIEFINRLGNVVRYNYDELNRLTKTISLTLDPEQPESITEIIYDIAGNISKRIDPYGYATEYFYNPFGDVVKIIQTYDNTNQTYNNRIGGMVWRQLITRNKYDKFRRIIETINPADYKISYKYDIRGRRIETINPLGQSEKTEYDKNGNIVTKIDAAGNKTEFRYNRRGQQIATILPKPSENEPSPITRQFYDLTGRLMSTVSADGIVNSLLADQYGRDIANFIGFLREKPTEVRNGKSIFVIDGILPNDEYDLFVSWSPVPNAGKISVNYLYDESFGKPVRKSLGEIDLTKKPERDSFLVPFCLKNYQRLTDSIKIFSNNVKIEFDGEVKNVSVYLLRSQAMSRIIYNDKGQVQTEIDVLENSVGYNYDNFGRQTSVAREGEVKSCCNEVKTFYNKRGQTFANLLPDGRLTIFGYDKLERQDRSYIGAIVETKLGEYKLEGLPIGEEFNIFVTKNPDEITSEITSKDTEKFQLGDLIFVKHSTIKTTESTLTGKLLNQSSTGQIAIIRKQPAQRIEFDFTGRAAAMYDANNHQTLFFYDSFGRQIAVVLPPTGEKKMRLAFEICYNSSGHIREYNIMSVAPHYLLNKRVWKPLSMNVEDKRTMQFTYNVFGQLIKVIQYDNDLYENGITKRYEYDIAGNRTKIIDPLGNETIYRYDNLRRKISETNAEGGETKFTYYKDGQMKSLTDPVGNTTSWTYNLLGKVSREIITLDGKFKERLFYYNANGNIVTKIDRNNRVTTWTYDKLNRATSENWYDTWQSFVDNKSPIKNITTKYQNGKIKSIEDGDSKFTFDYGIFGNEIKEIQNLADFSKPIEFNFVTDINGLITEKILKVDDKIDHVNSYEFDTLGQVTKINHRGKDVLTKQIQITYTPQGQIAEKNHYAENSLIVKTSNIYDKLQRLTKIVHSSQDKVFSIYNIKWDRYNRIIDFDCIHTDGLIPNKQLHYSYDKISQLTGVKSNSLSTESYVYDLNGNRKNAEYQNQKQQYQTGEYNRLLSDNSNSYKYDLEGNRTEKITSDGTTIKYFWDNRNRLIKVQTPTITITYLYDYLNRIVKRIQDKNDQYYVHDNWHIVLQFDNKNDKPTHRNLWGIKQDELICCDDDWMLRDHLNTIRTIIKSNGDIIHLDYDASGKLLTNFKKDTILFAYTGKLLDQFTNLQWNINRWYDSNVGRWMSEDPIGFSGKDINKYRYTLNSYMNGNDPLGLLTLKQASDIINIWSQRCVNGAPYESAIRGEIHAGNLLEGMWELAIDSMLIGIPNPESWIGKMTWTFVKDIISEALKNAPSGNSTNLSDETIKNIIKDVLQVPLEETTILVPVIRKLIEQSLNYNINECLLVHRERKHDTKLPNDSGTKSVKLDCVFMVCAKIKWGIFFNTIGKWSVKGHCHFECNSPPTPLCCAKINGEPLFNVNVEVNINREGNNGQNCQ
ncbi:MAG: hypothetical protein LBE18_00420 [Planctomycetaceae bacterium]|jgi:RHS repeat-associated protein|nr:hypothetical protein [Planctomycetaceae bacterium]